MQEQPWFEMPEIRRWPLDRAAWIPLRESHKCDEEGEFGREGYREGFVGAGTIAFLVEDRPVCEHLGWHDIGISHSQRGGCFSDGRYPPAGVFLSRVPADQPTEGRSSWQNVFGTHLVLEQYSDEGPPEWLLNQYIVVTLDLIREGDSWLCRERGYEEAALLTRKEDGTPMRLAIKSAYLKDYLREVHGLTRVFVSFPSGNRCEPRPYRLDWGFEGRGRFGPTLGRAYAEVHEGEGIFGGMQFGSKIGVFRAERTEVDDEEDVPTVTTGEGITSTSFSVASAGRKLFRVSGELWKDEWVEPGAASPIARGDKIPSTVEFVVELLGERETGGNLPPAAYTGCGSGRKLCQPFQCLRISAKLEHGVHR